MSVNIRTHDTAAGTAVTNTTTETSLAQHTFTADSLQAGKVFLIQAAIRATATNSSDTLLNTVRFGTNASTPGSNTSCGASNATDVADDDVAVVYALLSCHSATRAVISGFITAPDAAATDAVIDKIYAVLTIAADTTYYLDISATWSIASTANSCQSEHFDVIEIS